MIDIVDGQKQLIVVGLCTATVLSSTVRQYLQYRQIMRLVERQNPIIQQVSRRDRRFGRIQLALLWPPY